MEEGGMEEGGREEGGREEGEWNFSGRVKEQ
jgi:hypothetical protein